MAPKTTNLGNLSMANHTSGMYAAMDIDGPEIGTLVVVFDRAKNLPNLRTMGKQDPYCAARLGKIAKKTETDRRGGQTPRWDQEIRFTVHDSPDYHKLKVSVFNDDKKTDLIGEVWVNLEDLLRPGGGQADSWHQLNIKGRYAGEIRIELTYYDTRPKSERPRKQSTASSSTLQQQEQKQTTAIGPRQPIGRRPLPSNPGTPPSNITPGTHTGAAIMQNSMATPPDRSGGIPKPSTTPRSYHTPPPQQSLPQQAYESSHDHRYHAEITPDSNVFSDAFTTMPSYPASHAEPFYEPVRDLHEENSVYYLQDSHDAYAPLGATSQEPDLYARRESYLPRHDRVQTLSGSPDVRPSPPIGISHAYSAPELGPHEHGMQSSYEPYMDAADRADYADIPYAHPTPIDIPIDGAYNQAQSNCDYASPPYPQPYPRHQALPLSHDESGPPPPPLHRNSAPAAVKLHSRPSPAQYSTPPTRPLHVATATSELPGPPYAQRLSMNEQPSAHDRGQANVRPISSGMPYTTPLRHRSVDDYGTYDAGHQAYPRHLAIDADPLIRPRDELMYEPRYDNNASAEDYAQRPAPLKPHRPHSMTYVGQSSATGFSYSEEVRPSPRASMLIVKPQAISPSVQTGSSFLTPRKSISPRPSPDNRPSETAFSPDSFDVLNPLHSSRSASMLNDSNEPTPMYTPPYTTPTRAPPPPVTTELPILGIDGRVKDPTDHLPLSSYAPEPERKEKHRASTIINVKNRFGPREAANPSPPSTRPVSLPPKSKYPSPTADQRKRLYKRTSGIPSSPLSPAHSNTLNSNGVSQTPSLPPPIPAKVPLNYQSELDDYGTEGKMSALSAEIQNIDLGPANGAGRDRRNRYR